MSDLTNMPEPVLIDQDNFTNVKIAMEILGVDEVKAVNIFMEIGLFNMLNFPTGLEKIDSILKSGKYPELVKRMKSMWV